MIYFLLQTLCWDRMFSILCNTRLHQHRQVIENVYSCLQLSTSSQNLNSGKFRKVKPATASFLSRGPKTQQNSNTNSVFDHDYLNKTVNKILQGEYDKH